MDTTFEVVPWSEVEGLVVGFMEVLVDFMEVLAGSMAVLVGFMEVLVGFEKDLEGSMEVLTGLEITVDLFVELPVAFGLRSAGSDLDESTKKKDQIAFGS